jgi:hypothetical protein
MDGQMVSLGNRPPHLIEDSAGKIFPLLDVRGKGRSAESHPHLLGDGDEDALENLKLDRVNFFHLALTRAAINISL